jgi:nitrate/nitrite transport system substrate-binding protein
VHPIKADALKPVVEKFKADGKKFNMGMVFPTSTHNYALRYWLAGGGLHPGYYSATDISGQISADVLISVTPPPQMPATLESGTISGYSVGEPWNQQAVFKGIGVPVVTAFHIWTRTPEKIFGMRKDFIEKNPRTTVALTKALIRAALWLDADGGKNRAEAAKIFSKREYIGADYDVIVGPITGVYTYEKGDTRPLPEFNVYLQAAQELVAEGKLKDADIPKTDGYRTDKEAFIDGVEFDAKKPNEYLNKFKIGLKGNQKA